MADHSEIVDRLATVEAVVGGVVARIDDRNEWDTQAFSRIEVAVEKIDQKLDRTLERHEGRIRRLEYAMIGVIVALSAAGVRLAGVSVADLAHLFAAASG